MSDYYKPDDPNLVFIQSRAEIDLALVEEYAQMMRDGVQFHPARAIAEGYTIYVFDGFHRGEAAKLAGQLLFVSSRPGTRAEAEWAALNANQDHGMRRSNADKQKIVKLALTHEFGAKLSDRQIAHHCGVHHTMVGRIRGELEMTGALHQSDTRVGADGREINTANIGSSQPDYVTIWELGQGVKAWVTAKYSSYPRGQIETLQAIKQKRDEGPALLEELLTGDVLPGPRRKGDVVQAVNNVLAQLEEQERQALRQAQDVAAPAPEESGAEETQPDWLEETSAPPGGQVEAPLEQEGTPLPPAPIPQPLSPAPPPPPPPPAPKPAATPDWHLHITLKSTGICLVTLAQAGQAEPAANLVTHVDQVLDQVEQALGRHVPNFNGKEKEMIY
ncbi:MAG: hypothetical protein BroJett011_62520 [Chloroflexota bacterium]|nr:MAG: hypothetical protein BroJett011_62520 [Chloroflexota bacterium]